MTDYIMQQSTTTISAEEMKKMIERQGDKVLDTALKTQEGIYENIVKFESFT
jgi:hypothetical protein